MGKLLWKLLRKEVCYLCTKILIYKKVNVDFGKEYEQGNYSLRRPPKLIIPQIFIEQR